MLLTKADSRTGNPASEDDDRGVADLVARAQGGQVEAFGLLYRNYAAVIYRYVYVRTGRVEEAEDLTQEVFLKALNSIHSYRDQGKPFRSWLVRIAHNLLVDRYRRVDKVRFVPFTVPVVSSDGDPLDIVEREMENAMVMEAVANLTRKEREVISLRFGAQMSIAETAGILRKSQGAVKAAQHQAIARLRKEMGKEIE